MSSSSLARPGTVGGACAAAVGGLAIAALGVVALVAPATLDGTAWFLAAAVAAALLCVAILGLRAGVRDVPVARPALAVAAAGMALFALAHVYTLVDENTAILLFSVFLAVLSLGLIVGGVAIARARRGAARVVPLVCGAWPLATIPAASALGDVPHFSAIAVWGLCWVAFGAVLRPAADRAGAAVPGRTDARR